MQTKFYNEFHEKVKELYPSAPDDHSLSGAVSPYVISLSQEAFNLIEQSIVDLFLWSRDHSIQNNLIDTSLCSNYSVLMSYDFQINQYGLPKLIEINTNASGFLLADLVQKTHGILDGSPLEKLKQSFLNEWRLFNKSEQNPNPPRKTLIIDQNLDQQRMLAEFYMFHDLMRSWGWDNEIVDVSSLQYNSNNQVQTSEGDPVQFIYNRLTDFYLTQFPELKKSYETHNVCLSPNPKEYLHLADKNNLCQFYSQIHSQSNSIDMDLSSLKKILIKTEIMKSKEEAWKQRKKLFFKPLLGYGSKQVYRGSSITKKKFGELDQCVLQEYIPSQLWKDPHGEEWKFDIRVFAYKDQIQLITGRIYQGQLTNFSQPFSGYCSVVFK